MQSSKHKTYVELQVTPKSEVDMSTSALRVVSSVRSFIERLQAYLVSDFLVAMCVVQPYPWYDGLYHIAVM